MFSQHKLNDRATERFQQHLWQHKQPTIQSYNQVIKRSTYSSLFLLWSGPSPYHTLLTVERSVHVDQSYRAGPESAPRHDQLRESLGSNRDGNVLTDTREVAG